MDSIQAGKEVISETQQALKDAGMGLPRLVVKLGELLDAQKSISCVSGKDAGTKTMDFIEVPDNATQIKALDMAFELGNHYPPKNQKVEFPDANGKPQSIGGLFTDMERATRLVYLLDQAAKRKKNAKRGKKD